MEWKLDNNRPIYSQLIHLVKLGIVTGTFPAGSPMPSVRALAAEAGVNPNTMQKSLSGLEDVGLLFTHRTAGRFVTEDTKLIERVKQDLAEHHTNVFFEDMGSIGIGGKDAIEFAKKTLAAEHKPADKTSKEVN
jgi:DNA-binding transcriptional regulator YhcF (GntR family)